jgi:hypothetical protein
MRRPGSSLAKWQRTDGDQSEKCETVSLGAIPFGLPVRLLPLAKDDRQIVDRHLTNLQQLKPFLPGGLGDILKIADTQSGFWARRSRSNARAALAQSISFCTPGAPLTPIASIRICTACVPVGRSLKPSQLS